MPATETTAAKPALTKGARVRVRNSTLSGKPIIEGVATLVRRVGEWEENGRQNWLVRFDGERATYERWVSATDIATEAA